MVKILLLNLFFKFIGIVDSDVKLVSGILKVTQAHIHSFIDAFSMQATRQY